MADEKMKDPEFDGNIIQFLNGSHSFDGVWFGEDHPEIEGSFWWRKKLDDYNDRNKKLELLSSVANNMLHCIVTSQDISALKKARSSGKIVPWQEQALAQIELFQKLYKELNS